MSTFTIPTIFKAVDKLSAPMKRMKANMSSFATQSAAGIGKLDRGLRKLTPSLGAMGKQMLAFASVGLLISGIGSAINIVKDFEQANANLAGKMGLAVEQTRALKEDAIRLGSVTSKTATEVSELQFAYAGLGFEQQQILDMTEATIAGSNAMNSELGDTAELAGAMIKTFASFSSTDAPEILDQMTIATQKSALNFEKLQTALPIVSKAADASGVSFTEMSSSLGILANSGIDASSSATALRNIYLEAAKRGVPYQSLIDKISNSTDKLGLANKIFGKRGAVVAVTLAENQAGLKKLQGDIESAGAGMINAGVAGRTAATQLDTLDGALTLLGSAYEGLLLKINDGTGALGLFKNVVQFVANNIEGIATIIGVVVGAFLALKLAVVAGQAAMFAYNVVLGISSVMSAEHAVSVGASNVAMKAQQIASYAVAAAQWVLSGGLMAATTAAWAFAAALLANPLTWIILAIVALGAAIVGLIVYWEEIVAWVTESDSVFAKLIRVALLPIIMLFKAIGFAIDIVVSMFSSLVEWVQTSDSAFAGFIRGTLSSIGQYFTDIGTGIDIVIGGLSSLWDWLSNFTMEALAPIMSMIDMFSGIAQDELGVDVNKNITGELTAENPEAIKQDALTSKIVEQSSETVTIDINDNSGGKADVQGGSANNVKLNTTMTGGQ